MFQPPLRFEFTGAVSTKCQNQQFDRAVKATNTYPILNRIEFVVKPKRCLATYRFDVGCCTVGCCTLKGLDSTPESAVNTTNKPMQILVEPVQSVRRQTLRATLWMTFALMIATVAFACASEEPTATPEPTVPPPTATPELAPVAQISDSTTSAESLDEMMAEPVMPFTNIAPLVLVDPETGEELWMIENRHPGVAIFDYDRDGDMDFYVTSAEIDALLPDTTGGPNRLFRNDGDHVYTEVAEQGWSRPARSRTAPASPHATLTTTVTKTSTSPLTAGSATT